MPTYPHEIFPHTKQKSPKHLPSDAKKGSKKDAKDAKDIDFPPQQQQLTQPQIDPGMTDATTDTSAFAGLGAGGDTGGEAISGATMFGRADAQNRFNLFDSLGAVPQTRIWFGFQYIDGFRTGAIDAAPTPPGSGVQDAIGLVGRRQQQLYRMGLEYAFSERASFVAQHQYIAGGTVVRAEDAWGNPEFALKYAVIYRPDLVVSAVFGIAPEISSTDGELHETTTRFYPGLLFYRPVTDRFFVQGGMQFGIADDNLQQTFDYALSFGYWAYGDPCGNGCGRGGCGCDDCGCGRRNLRSPILRGIIPQLEFLGKELIANGDTIPYDLPLSGPGSVDFNEGRHVYDITFGARFLIGRVTNLVVGASFPLTGPEVREAELITTVSFNF